MFVVPLGLGTKLKWTPWITAAILLTWFANFFVDPFREEISHQLGIAASKSGIKDASRNLFIDYCLQREGQLNKCKELSKLLWTGFPSKKDIIPKLKDKPVQLEKFLAREFENAARIRESLKDCGLSKKPKQCLQYKEIFWKFSRATDYLVPPKSQGIIPGLPSYKRYTLALKDFHNRMAVICKNNACLTNTNIKPSSVFLALVRHDGLMHLVGNVVIFVIFGVYVEQKLHPWIFGSGMLLSGILGMIIHAKIWGTPDTFIIGGSTIVSGVIGLFYSLFFNRKLCLRVILPRKLYLGSNLYVSAKYAIPFLFVMTDIAGSMNLGYNELGISHVAHFAHLSSFICGVLIGLGLVHLDKNSNRELYRDGFKDSKKILMSPPGIKTLRESARFLEYDSTHEEIMLCGLRSYFICLAKGKLAGSSREMEFARKFSRKYTALFLHQALRSRKERIQDSSSIVTTEQFVRLFDLIPPNVDLKEVLGELEPRTLIKLGLVLITKEIGGMQGCFYHALRIFDLFLTQFPHSKVSSKLLSFCRDIIVQFVPFDNSFGKQTPQIAHLEIYLKTHSKSFLTAIIEDHRRAQPTKLKVS